jgi:GYF domain 2
MDKYWIFQGGQPDGPYEASALVAMAGFTESTLVCLEGDDNWRAGREVPEICQALGIPSPRRVQVAHDAVQRNDRIWRSGDITGPDFQFERPWKHLPKQTIRKGQSATYKPAFDWLAPRPLVPRYAKVLFLAAALWMAGSEWPLIQSHMRRAWLNVTGGSSIGWVWR